MYLTFVYIIDFFVLILFVLGSGDGLCYYPRVEQIFGVRHLHLRIVTSEGAAATAAG